jgi:hypothetical protein
MSGFSDLFLELRMTLDDPEAFNSKISTQLDPNLVDQLTAYAASRNVPLSQKALEASFVIVLRKDGRPNRFPDGSRVATNAVCGL